MNALHLTFEVPPAARSAVLADFANRPASVERRSCSARWYDLPDRRLARQGLGWHVRRDHRQWLQALAGVADEPWHPAAHQVVLPGEPPEASHHAGSAPGDRLLALLRKAQAQGQAPEVCLQGDWKRLTRRIRSRGAVVQVSLDAVRVTAGGQVLRASRLVLQHVSGPGAAFFALAERWRARHGLVLDPLTPVERGHALAGDEPLDPPRRAQALRYARQAGAAEALGAVLDECLDQILRNAIGIANADAPQAVEHVHQFRVGVRRLRGALRAFEHGFAPPPAPLIEGLRQLFATLGSVRDDDVLSTGVAAALQAVGAPPLATLAATERIDPRTLLRKPETQRLLLAWLAWRHTALSAEVPDPADADPEVAGAAMADREEAATDLARRRLRRWQRRIEADGSAFASLDETAIHALRKRIKRQRYAVEFLAPLLQRRDLRRYLELLAAAQQQLGELNDLFTARARYQAQAQDQPAAWFALGWLAARIADCRSASAPALFALARAKVPGRAG